jgi:hypothetical protein
VTIHRNIRVLVTFDGNAALFPAAAVVLVHVLLLRPTPPPLRVTPKRHHISTNK